MSRDPASVLSDGAAFVTHSLRLGAGAVEALLADLRLRPRGRCAPATRFLGPSGCEIPPPCWYPRAAGALTSHVCPGGTATLRIRVENCGPVRRTVTLEAPAGIKLEPDTLDLGPMERGACVASRPLGATASAGDSEEVLIWIHACHKHFIRWTVAAARRGADCCHEVCLQDCPDELHHWYDHFYCHHPCAAGA